MLNARLCGLGGIAGRRLDQGTRGRVGGLCREEEGVGEKGGKGMDGGRERSVRRQVNTWGSRDLGDMSGRG